MRRRTPTMVEIEGERMRGVTWVYINELKPGDLGVDGQTLTATDVHRLQTGEDAAWPAAGD